MHIFNLFEHYMEINWGAIYQQYNFIKNQDKNKITEFIISNINSDKGWFLNRLGGSDYDAVKTYILSNKDLNKINISHNIKLRKIAKWIF